MIYDPYRKAPARVAKGRRDYAKHKHIIVQKNIEHILGKIQMAKEELEDRCITKKEYKNTVTKLRKTLTKWRNHK